MVEALKERGWYKGVPCLKCDQCGLTDSINCVYNACRVIKLIRQVGRVEDPTNVIISVLEQFKAVSRAFFVLEVQRCHVMILNAYSR